MSKVYAVWLIPNDGDGIPQSLADWVEEDGPLTLRLNAFASDAVIEIEPKIQDEI